MTAAADRHYESADIDPMFVAAARDHLYSHLRPGRILNLGLGYGTWDERLSTESSSQVIGLDMSQTLVDRFASRYPSIEYVCCDVFDYVPDGQFDTISASHFLEHIAEPVRLLDKLRAWLAPGGRILLVVPNAHSFHRHLGKHMGFLNQVTDLNDGDHMLGHQRVYTTDELASHVAEAGLQIEQVGGVTFKPLSNAQLADMPSGYVDACCAMGAELGPGACQIALVAHA